jgi:antitoxin MazE
MKAKLISIGNSKGIRIPKPVIEQCGFGETVEMVAKNKTLVITAARRVRQGWDEAFGKMAERGDDRLLDEDVRDAHWDEDEWRW